MNRFDLYFDPFKPATGAPPQTLGRFFGWSMKGSEWAVFVMAVTFIVLGFMEAGVAYIVGSLVDTMAQSNAQDFWRENAVFLILSAAFFVGLRPAMNYLSTYVTRLIVGPRAFIMVLSRLYRWTLGQNLTFFEEDFSGRITQKQMQTADTISGLVINFAHTFLYALSTMVAALFLLVSIDARLVPILAIWVVLYGLLLRYFTPKIREKGEAAANAESIVTGQLVDTMANIKSVKLFAHDKHEDEITQNTMKDEMKADIEAGVVRAQFAACLHVVSGFMPAILIGLSILFWHSGSMSVGQVAATATIATRIAQMAGWISFSLMDMYEMVGIAEDGIKLLTKRPRLIDAADARAIEVRNGQISFDQVRFRYGQDIGGVDGVSLEIAAGEKLGIVGASGAGKSTMVSLLLRLYDVEAGTIRIDGQELRSLTQESLRKNIGLVTQETELFNRSAYDNIAYGQPDAPRDAVIAAARQASAHGFIETLKDQKDRLGYEAHLGERGVKLSGGQRQRIALARAILKDAPILVLDEATSALDSEIEAEIQNALTQVMQGKTVIAIAHRLSTLRAMDRIIVLREGRIAEEGSHETLLARGGLYAQFWTRQSDGFIQTELAS